MLQKFKRQLIVDLTMKKSEYRNAKSLISILRLFLFMGEKSVK